MCVHCISSILNFLNQFSLLNLQFTFSTPSCSKAQANLGCVFSGHTAATVKETTNSKQTSKRANSSPCPGDVKLCQFVQGTCRLEHDHLEASQMQYLMAGGDAGLATPIIRNHDVSQDASSDSLGSEMKRKNLPGA